MKSMLTSRRISSRSSVTRKLLKASVMLASLLWSGAGLTRGFTSEEFGGWVCKLPGFDRILRTDVRSLRELPQLSKAHHEVQGCGRPRNVQLTRVQKLLVCLYALLHPGTTRARPAIWAKCEFRLVRAPSRSSVGVMFKRRWEEVDPGPGDEHLPERDARFLGRM
jgi:hypothetical protein